MEKGVEAEAPDYASRGAKEAPNGFGLRISELQWNQPGSEVEHEQRD